MYMRKKYIKCSGGESVTYVGLRTDVDLYTRIFIYVAKSCVSGADVGQGKPVVVCLPCIYTSL